VSKKTKTKTMETKIATYYFAYGHNTEKRTMLQRIPEARLVGTAVLPKHRLVLREFADVVKERKHQNQSDVLGVLWKMPKASLTKLDRIELFYARKLEWVSFQGKRVKAWVYFMNRRTKPNPTRKYVAALKRGYRENRIPQAQLTRKNHLKKRLHHANDVGDGALR